MYELDFLRALGITIFTETLLLFWVVRSFYNIPQEQISTTLILFGGILSSGATLPYVWFVLPVFVKSFLLYTLVAESFAVLAEAGIFRMLFRIAPPKALLLSVICNLGSFGVGRLL